LAATMWRALIELNSAGVKPKRLATSPRNCSSCRLHFLVSFRDVKETVKHALKQLSIAFEDCDELFGAGLEVGCVPLGN
jgi:hypothetical protein